MNISKVLVLFCFSYNPVKNVHYNLSTTVYILNWAWSRYMYKNYGVIKHLNLLYQDACMNDLHTEALEFLKKSVKNRKSLKINLYKYWHL